jgi:AP-1 complex subunit gamma-1
MKCSKESGDTASIQAVFSNKTGYLVENLVFQVAVMKHLKLAVNPLNSTSMQPYSRDSVIQVEH